jgi:hypothetical protein
MWAEALYPLGRIVATPGAIDGLTRANQWSHHFSIGISAPIGRDQRRIQGAERIQPYPWPSKVEQLHHGRRRKGERIW